MPAPRDTRPTALKAFADHLWSLRTHWDKLYEDAYRYAVPHRRPGTRHGTKDIALEIFDMTAPASAMHFAGQLQRQLFPAGQDPFLIQAGPLARAQLAREKGQLDRLNDQMAQLSSTVYPYFQTGSFDTAMHETCTDLGIGTGAILPVRGPSIEEPLYFVNIPIDELACSYDQWGRLSYASWKREVSLGNLVEFWPEGTYTGELKERARKKPNDTVQLYQDFFRTPEGFWRFVAYVKEQPEVFIADVATLAQPLSVGRFYRAPGEDYGRGPVLINLPGIKTANKAQELALKSAAIQMLGIWGYRSGGTFNPDSVRLGPGEFWPMQSTGGVLGPDVSRIDTASGRLDVAKMVTTDLQRQIRDGLLDTRIFDDGGTPPSASEVAARMRQSAGVHVGAFGRLTNELVPPLVTRSIEILQEWRLIDMPLPLNRLLFSVEVRSPMMAALKADKMQALANYIDMVAALAGPDRLARYIDIDGAIELARDALQVDRKLVPDAAAQEKFDADQAQQMAAAEMGQIAERAAPQLVQMAAQDEAA